MNTIFFLCIALVAAGAFLARLGLRSRRRAIAGIVSGQKLSRRPASPLDPTISLEQIEREFEESLRQYNQEMREYRKLQKVLSAQSKSKPDVQSPPRSKSLQSSVAQSKSKAPRMKRNLADSIAAQTASAEAQSPRNSSVALRIKPNAIDRASVSAPKSASPSPLSISSTSISDPNTRLIQRPTCLSACISLFKTIAICLWRHARFLSLATLFWRSRQDPRAQSNPAPARTEMNRAA
jgi:hypothetical protein